MQCYCCNLIMCDTWRVFFNMEELMIMVLITLLIESNTLLHSIWYETMLQTDVSSNGKNWSWKCQSKLTAWFASVVYLMEMPPRTVVKWNHLMMLCFERLLYWTRWIDPMKRLHMIMEWFNVRGISWGA